jgi:predicted transposase YdaD
LFGERSAEYLRCDASLYPLGCDSGKYHESDPILLPFASLASHNPSEELLRRVAAEVDKIAGVEQRRDVASYVQVIAGLRFSKTIIQRLFQEDMMRESVIYQDILQQGEDQGIRQGLERELELVYRQLTKKLGALPGDVRSTLAALPIDRLELLGVDLFDFEGFADFQAWLAR